MRKVVFIFLFLYSSFSVFAKNDSLPIIYDTVPVKFYVTDTKNNQPLKDAFAIVKKNNNIFFTTDSTTKTGEKNLYLPLAECEYSITVSQKNYYSKIITVNTKKISAKRMKRQFASIDIGISLYEKLPNIKFPMLEQPVLKYYYSKYEEEFIQDFDYSIKIIKDKEIIAAKIKEYQVWKKDSFQSAQINRADSFYNAAGNKIIKTYTKIDSALFLEAINDYYSAIKLKPDFWEAYLGKANIHIYLKQYAQAIIDLTAAIKYAGSNANTILYQKRGEALYYSGNYEYAIKDFDIAIEKNTGTNDIPLIIRAKAKWKLGKYDDACADYKQALGLNKSLEEQKDFLECK